VKLVLTVLVLDAQSLDTFTLPKSVAAHATSLVLAALLVWLLARYGRRLLFWSPVHVAAGALLLAFVLATPFALDQTVAVFGTFRRYLGLTQMLDNVLLYVAAGLLLRDARSLRLLGIVTLGTALPVLLYAFVQKLGLDPLKFREGTVPISFLGNPDLAGAYLAMAGIAAFGVAFLLSDRLSRPLLAGLVALGLVCTATLFTTGVRAGVLALGSGFAAIALLAFLLPWARVWWRKGLLAFGALLILAVVVSPVAGRIKPDALRNDAAIIQRLAIWETAEKAVLQRPILGLGPDNFVVFYPANRTEASAQFGVLENSTHSFWLYVATSAGLVGLLALLVLIALVIERGIRAARQGRVGALALVPLFAYLGQSFVGVNELVLDWVFWLSAGVVAAAGAQALRRPRTGYPRPRTATLTGAIAIGAAAVVIVTLLLPRLAAGEAMALTEAYSAANRARDAIPYGQAAVAADPRRGETWSTYGTALARGGSLTAAVAAFTASVQREPWLSIGWRNLAIVWAQLGNRTAAIASVERGIRSDPYDGEAHDLLASLAYDAGDYARAAAEGERAIVLRTPPQESTYFTTASAYAQLKDLAKAEAIVRAGIKAYPNALLRLQLAAILADEGKKAEAIAVVDALLAEQPNNPEAQALKKALAAR
jgi:tetratricopeptide (TPR) repeat protein